MGKELIALSEYLKSVRTKPFKWGEHDCVLHACNGLKAVTGTDIAAEWRGTYDSALSAKKIIKKCFDGDMDNGFTRFLGEPHSNALKACRGDVVRITENGEHTYGIIDDTGRHAVMITVKEGLMKISLSEIEKVWSSTCLL